MSLRKRLAIVLSALSIMMVMSLPPAIANEGHKGNDGPDFNKGGGQETPKNENRKNGQLDPV